jgi:hypothetical protein
VEKIFQTSKQGYEDFSAQRSEKQGFSNRNMLTKNEFFVLVAGKDILRIVLRWTRQFHIFAVVTTILNVRALFGAHRRNTNQGQS